MTTSAQLNWGLISTARINYAIRGALPHSQRGTLLGVASRDAARAEAYAREHNIPRAYGSYEAMLADPDIHIVYNPLPNHLHAEWTIKALEAGKHVLCEKPFALTLAEVDAMYAAAQRTGRVLAEAFMYRHHPKTLKTKELLESGALGNVHFMRASFSFYLNRPEDIRWQADMGGGALWDVGCYPVSLARYLFGVPERVTAWQRRWSTGVDETLAATLYFPGERVAQIDCSFQMPYRTHAEIVGDQGILTLTRPFQPDFPEAQLLLQRGDTVEEIQLDNPGRYQGEVEDMHDAILLGQPPLVTPAETRGHVETILELYRAAA